MFEAVILVLISANCVVLAFDDPTDDVAPLWQKWSDLGFQIVYTVELVMKICALGLVVPEDAFLRNVWNIADLVVVILGYLHFMGMDSTNFDPRPLRVFRVLIAFHTITNIKNMKAIITVLLNSFSLLFYILIIYLFYLVVFAIVGLQLWHDAFKVRCTSQTTQCALGRLCGYMQCPEGFVCSHYYESLNSGIVSFDNFFDALLVAFIVSTDEGGPEIQKALIEVKGYYVTVYFTLIVIIGSYFLRHFVLGIFQYNVTLLYAENQKVTETKVSIVCDPLYRCKTLRIPSSFRNHSELHRTLRTHPRRGQGLGTSPANLQPHNRTNGD